MVMGGNYIGDLDITPFDRYMKKGEMMLWQMFVVVAVRRYHF